MKTARRPIARTKPTTGWSIGQPIRGVTHSDREARFSTTLPDGTLVEGPRGYVDDWPPAFGGPL